MKLCSVSSAQSAAWRYPGGEGGGRSYLCVERSRARDEAGDDQGEDHQLQQPHEELARVGHQSDGLGGQVQLSQGDAEDEARDDTWQRESNDDELIEDRGRPAGEIDVSL